MRLYYKKVEKKTILAYKLHFLNPNLGLIRKKILYLRHKKRMYRMQLTL